MPFDILDLIEKDETLATCQCFNAEVCYGSGLFTPVASMPQWAQAITRLNSLRYFIEVMRMVYLKGSTMCELLPQLRALCTYAVAMGIWAIFSYRKTD